MPDPINMTWDELKYRLTHCDECDCEVDHKRCGCKCECHDPIPEDERNA